MLEVGSSVADFTLQDQTGQPVSWSSFRGKPVVFFFYPKADTPGCTKEACAFRDLRADFDALGVAVVGVSADSVKRQAGFVAKYGLTMPLLADPEQVILAPWGIWAEKKNYGRTYFGIVRSTVLFDAAGKVAQTWSNVKVDGHAQKVLEAARALTAVG
jgi:peroxiredoxin Q/BCP